MKRKNKVCAADYKWITLFLVLDTLALALLPIVFR